MHLKLYIRVLKDISAARHDCQIQSNSETQGLAPNVGPLETRSLRGSKNNCINKTVSADVLSDSQ